MIPPESSHSERLSDYIRSLQLRPQLCQQPDRRCVHPRLPPCCIGVSAPTALAWHICQTPALFPASSSRLTLHTPWTYSPTCTRTSACLRSSARQGSGCTSSQVHLRAYENSPPPFPHGITSVFTHLVNEHVRVVSLQLGANCSLSLHDVAIYEGGRGGGIWRRSQC